MVPEYMRAKRILMLRQADVVLRMSKAMGKLHSTNCTAIEHAN